MLVFNGESILTDFTSTSGTRLALLLSQQALCYAWIVNHASYGASVWHMDTIYLLSLGNCVCSDGED